MINKRNFDKKTQLLQMAAVRQDKEEHNASFSENRNNRILKMFILLSSWHYNSSYKHALPKLLEGFVRLYFFIGIRTPFLSDVTIDKQLHSFKRQLYSITTLKQELLINPSLVSLPFHNFFICLVK